MRKRTIKHILFAFLLFFCFGSVHSQETEKVRVYRVQFAASKTFIKPSYFKAKFKLEDEVEYFEKDGYYKYYVGEFATNAEATAYYHATNSVGYVISVLIDKPIVIQEDTIQVVDDSSGLNIDEQDSSESIVRDSIVKDTAQQEILKPTPSEDQKRDGAITGFQLVLICMICLVAIVIVIMVIRYLKRRDEISMDGRASDEKNESGSELKEPDLALSGKKSFSFLDQTDKDLSGWEQLRLHEQIKGMKKAPPEFSSWLDSENPSIVAFCLRMIRSFTQTGAYSAVVRLLDHKDDDIRAEAVVTLGDIGNRQVLGIFREKFDSENYTNRMLILRAMARMPDDSNIDFLKGIISNHADYRIEAAHALASIKTVGIEGVEEALKDLGDSAEIIARHILINKL